MNQQLRSLKMKLTELQRKDTNYKLFGADRHCYLLNPVARASDVRAFETRFQLSLPEGYRQFLLELGNGGAGPYYGLEPIENGRFADLDHKDDSKLIDPSHAFTLKDRWNLEYTGEAPPSERYSKFEREYFDTKWADGLIRICNFGCGVSLNLVVNGPEYGNIWVDDRCNDGGIYPDPYFDQPGRTEFLNWYELWLDRSLREVP